MKPERWYQRLMRHGLLRLVAQTLLIYLTIALLAQFLVLSIATPETHFQLEILHGFVMLLVTAALVIWLAARYTAQVRHGEARYRQIVEQATDGIFVCDLAGNLLDVNPATCAMLGYTRWLMAQHIGAPTWNYHLVWPHLLTSLLVLPLWMTLVHTAAPSLVSRKFSRSATPAAAPERRTWCRRSQHRAP